MKEFKIIINGVLETEWLDASEWTAQDLEQFLEFGNAQYEFR